MDPISQSNKIKQMNIILLVDNRKDPETASKGKPYDFRSSAFKQTQVDPLQPRPDIFNFNQEDTILFNLKRKVFELQKRVSRLETQTSKDTQLQKAQDEETKKKRRKFAEMSRELKCPHVGCQKLYGSETSLKNHLKLKHNKQECAH